ncbi:MAG: pilin [Candidatus Thiodiazotropha taylori]
MKASFATLLTVFGTLGILGALIFPIDNFSYVAASITANGVKTAQPVQLAVEAYQAKHGLFPDAAMDSNLTSEVMIEDHHIRSIHLKHGGRIEITYDTQDIDWGISWWHQLLLIESNDLSGKTLVLVPSLAEGGIVWDECSEGTVPKRSRHYQCSAHK